jgi:hypothetical protein
MYSLSSFSDFLFVSVLIAPFHIFHLFTAFYYITKFVLSLSSFFSFFSFSPSDFKLFINHCYSILSLFLHCFAHFRFPLSLLILSSNLCSWPDYVVLSVFRFVLFVSIVICFLLYIFSFLSLLCCLISYIFFALDSSLSPFVTLFLFIFQQDCVF